MKNKLVLFFGISISFFHWKWISIVHWMLSISLKKNFCHRWSRFWTKSLFATLIFSFQKCFCEKWPFFLTSNQSPSKMVALVVRKPRYSETTFNFWSNGILYNMPMFMKKPSLNIFSQKYSCCPKMRSSFLEPCHICNTN